MGIRIFAVLGSVRFPEFSMAWGPKPIPMAGQVIGIKCRGLNDYICYFGARMATTV